MAGMDNHSIQRILLEYDREKELYADFLTMNLRLFKEFIKENAVVVYSIEGFLMDREALRNWLETTTTPVQSLKDIEDLVTIRVLTHFEDEVVRVSDILKSAFSVVRDVFGEGKIQEPKRFGYHSHYYLTRMMDARLELIEYRRFRACQVMFQIRSLLQHTWLSIQKRLDFPNETALPQELRRPAARIVGLFELADRQLNTLKQEVTLAAAEPEPQPQEGVELAVKLAKKPAKASKKNADKGKKSGKKTAPVKPVPPKPKSQKEASATPSPSEHPRWSGEEWSKLVLGDSLIRSLDRKIADLFDLRLKFHEPFIQQLEAIAAKFDIHSQESLLESLVRNEAAIVSHSGKLFEGADVADVDFIVRGISILLLLLHIAIEVKDQEAMDEILAIMQIPLEPSI
ncbi:MAG: hypothetical protein HQL52_09470 [Magnetococcales bacterium]|nr:hypothetical protein [Magnetococcales bacterium]